LKYLASLNSHGIRVLVTEDDGDSSPKEAGWTRRSNEILSVIFATVLSIGLIKIFHLISWYWEYDSWNNNIRYSFM